MKFIPALFIALSLALAATAAEGPLSPALAGSRNVYFRVVLEKPNGFDMRENAMPKSVIDAIERRGASVRPNHTSAIVSYWIFFKNGDFAVADIINDAAKANLPYGKLEVEFADAPRNGPKWNMEGENLVIGDRNYSIRTLTANEPGTGGRKGEVEIAVLDGKEKVYFYFGAFVAP